VPPPKLHLNENLSPRLAEQLRKLGFDVTSTLELGMTEVDDDAQLAFSASQRRAVVTVNHKDFAVLHDQFQAKGKEHWGIILSTEENVSVLRRRLLGLLNSVSADELKNQIRWLNEFK
jgi:predicted nuclease of predicted toxin-antitoxin system